MLRSMPEERLIRVIGDAGVQLAVRVFESPSPDAPGVLLHHGLASSQHIWDRMLPRLTRHMQVVTYDARGHGMSAKPNRGYGFDHVVADALAVSRAAELERPVVVGHSWGAMVTLELAGRHPDAVTGAVLVDGGMHPVGAEMDWPTTKQELAPPHLTGMRLEEFRRLMRSFFGEAVELTPDLEAQVLSVMRVRRDGTIAPRLARSNHFRILRAIWEQDPYELWAHLRVPTLSIVARDRADAVRYERMRGAVARVRASTRGHPVAIEWMDGIHDLPLQHPEALARRIERFAQVAVG
ncbi:MAG TPA: alpha/beta hydrolase [Actinomycetota bacterium]